MTVIIRPQPEVFRQTARLLVVFGAYRRFDQASPFVPEEEDRLADMIATARKYRVSLAFSRRTRPDGTGYPGAWLPGCRPRISDMVFNHRACSSFSNLEMLDALRRISASRIEFTGPESDAEIDASLADAAGFGLRVERVGLRKAMHKCSASSEPMVNYVNFPPPRGQTAATAYGHWLSSLRVISSTE